MVRERFRIVLSEEEVEALARAAEEDCRPLGDQARYFLREALRRRGLLRDADPQEVRR